MAHQISSPVVDPTGKTRLQASLERAKLRQGPSLGQWLEFPGYTLARTVASLGEDVRYSYIHKSRIELVADFFPVGIDRLRAWQYRRQ
jgi:hypothetical protein